MLKSYIRVALRNLKRNLGFTVLNLVGLSLGLIVALLIMFYVVDEWSYDRYNVNADRIYRINTDVKFGSNVQSFAQGSPAIGEALVRTFPEVENSVRLAQDEGERFKKGDMVILEDRVAYCDPQLFDVFTLSGIEGDLRTALKEPNSVVITESTAKKYFNQTDVVGQTLTILGDSGHTTIEKITAVIRDIPRESHFNFDFFLSMTSLSQSHDINFNSLNFTTYLLLKPGADAKKLEAKFPAFLRKALASQANA
ncbi:MAG TPA: ABC transporter permease, partial [Niastella sp.]